MGFTKNKAISIVASLIAIIVFSIFAFVLPVPRSVVFWLGYSFFVFSASLLLSTSLIALNNSDLKSRFFSLPAPGIAWIYFIIQLFLSVHQMTNFIFPYFSAVITDTVLAAVFSILVLLTYRAQSTITKIEEKTARKTFFIKNLQSDVEILRSDVTDSQLKEKLKNLAELIRFSDPMSHSQLETIEYTIEQKVYLLKETIADTGKSSEICDDIKKLFNERNSKCKLLKNVPEPKPQADNSGIKIMAVTFGIISTAIIVILLICFVIVPANKYKAACTLYEKGEYEEAIVIFEDLGNYRNSTMMIELSREALIEEKYEIANAYYDDERFVDAMAIYSELGDYKDSRDQIEHISNLFTEGSDIYYGMYKGEPVLWNILYTDSDKMLLITRDIVEEMAYNDELKNITWSTSSIRQWLTDDFTEDFSDKQMNRIIKNDTDDLNDNIFLLSEDEFNTYREHFDSTASSDWWLRTKTSAGMMFVSGETGELNTYGEGVVHSMGIRPCVWLTLK